MSSIAVLLVSICLEHSLFPTDMHDYVAFCQARAQSARARRACALRALGLLLADGTPTVGEGKTF